MRRGDKKLNFAMDNVSSIEQRVERQMRLVEKLTSLDEHHPMMKRLEKLEEDLDNALLTRMPSLLQR